MFGHMVDSAEAPEFGAMSRHTIREKIPKVWCDGEQVRRRYVKSPDTTWLYMCSQ